MPTDSVQTSVKFIMHPSSSSSSIYGSNCSIFRIKQYWKKFDCSLWEMLWVPNENAARETKFLKRDWFCQWGNFPFFNPPLSINRTIFTDKNSMGNYSLWTFASKEIRSVDCNFKKFCSNLYSYTFRTLKGFDNTTKGYSFLPCQNVALSHPVCAVV